MLKVNGITETPTQLTLSPQLAHCVLAAYRFIESLM